MAHLRDSGNVKPALETISAFTVMSDRLSMLWCSRRGGGSQLRIALALPIAAAAVLGGCTLWPGRQATFNAPGPCGVVARQRLSDAEIGGWAEGYEKAIFDRTYRDCLAMQDRYAKP